MNTFGLRWIAGPVIQLACMMLLALLFSCPVRAAQPDFAGRIESADGNAFVTAAAPHEYAWAYLETDTYTSEFTLEVASQDRGRAGQLYLGATLDGTWFIKTPDGWIPWDHTLEGLIPYQEVELADSHTFDVLADNNLPPGEFYFWAAYVIPGNEPVISPAPLHFVVHPANQDVLHPFRSSLAMETFLKKALQNSSGNQFYASGDFVLAATAEDSSGGSGRVSGTNLQEQGVDEADVVKADADHLLLLRTCELTTCIVTYELDSEKVEARELSSVPLSGSQTANGMYLITGEGSPTAGTSDTLVTLAGNQNNHLWLDVWGWGSNRTELEFFDASDPAQLESLETLTLDGSLVSSRRVGDTLYVVTRYTPFIEGWIPYAYDVESLAANDALLSDVTLSELLPKAVDSNDNESDLVDAENCYLTTSNLEQGVNPSIVTVSAIPLTQPLEYQSTCFIGDSETLYMTPQSLYLATTRYEYSNLEFDRLFYQPDHTTAVHKFALAESGITYRGSGQVKGHLGWTEDKKSFRMGENGDYLNIVTSVGETWDGSSSTLLTVLKEADSASQLKTVDSIEGIGKPGEQLYAARFVGDRAYLVTFLLTDPLYVIDLSNQEKPSIAGELQIDGYSDYLHPISDELLLGIGKDAVADSQSSDFNGTRGAWYQGVKLSLFNVADPADPVELSSVVLGRRGTQSEVLYDHHALSFLPAIGEEPARIAIPVDLYDTIPTHPWFDPAAPNAWYDYTHTGLYSFEIDDTEIKQVGLVYGTEPGSIGYYSPFGDRSVLVDNAVFYVHQGEVIASEWGEYP
ncbi:MAG: beta-propeller domain-containing protein [Gammaproteobacteria bacterium]|nr:beta-propeller domain-containing protein [Pseudomonadales bacterium]MCP5346526.1 beta-propeller domain-containing protein [Pseudomonadales bacterium]